MGDPPSAGTPPSAREIPLFPLNTVLFPGTWLPLRVFEPRYRQMVADCLDGERAFGVALIMFGEEVAGPATPHRIGTVARIQEVGQDGGMFHLLVRGDQRFEVESLLEGGAYPRARVRVLPPLEVRDGDEAAARDLRLMHELYVKALGRAARVLRQPWPPELLAPIPTGDALVVANWVGWMLPTDNGRKQEILEAASVKEMLAAERQVLGADLQKWESVLRKPTPG